MSYLWHHEPVLSAPPIEVLAHQLVHLDDDEIQEIAVFKLENNKFLYICFMGVLTHLDNGITDVEECDDFETAHNLFELYKVNYT